MWALQDAKNRFSAVVDAALGGMPQEVSRRGKPAVVVVSAADYQRLVTTALAIAQQTRTSFADHLLAFPGSGPESGPNSGRAQVQPRDVRF